MSKTSRFFLAVMVVGLAFLAGTRLYQLYERRAAQDAAEPVPTQTFNQVPVRQGPAEIDPPVYKRLPEQEKPQEVYLQDAPLSAAQQKVQAQQTLQSILADYASHPKMQAFYADLARATGRTDITLESLSGAALPELMKKYPQVQEVLAKHSKDPEFVKTLQEIFSNPQFVHSVAVLQGGVPARSGW